MSNDGFTVPQLKLAAVYRHALELSAIPEYFMRRAIRSVGLTPFGGSVNVGRIEINWKACVQTTEQIFELSSPLEPDQVRFLLSGLGRSGLFAVYDLKGSKLIFHLAEGGTTEAAAATWKRLVSLAARHKVETVFERRRSAPLLNSVTQALIDKEDLKKLGPGCFVFQGDFLSLMNWIDQRVIELANSLKAQEQQYPVLWPIELYKRLNYFRDFPHNALLATGVKKSNQTMQKFSESYKASADFSEIQLSEEMAPITHALGSSTCDPCYYAFRDGNLNTDRIFHAKSKCFRNESSASDELDRLREFTMREVIAVGSERHVLNVRERFFEFARELIDQMELSGRIESANDPFFTNDSMLKKLFQDSLKAKYEIVAETGGTTGDLAVGSINWHADQFGRAFGVSLSNGEPMRSCCIGIGFERLAFALVAQHGVNPQNWPIAVKARV